MINNYVRAWRVRGMEHARREIGALVVDEHRRLIPGVELRQRTKLNRALMYRTLDSLVGQGWIGVHPMNLSGRRMNGYYITERGKLLFAELLGHSSGDDDIHSGDNSCRQVTETQCVSNASTPTTYPSSPRPERRW